MHVIDCIPMNKWRVFDKESDEKSFWETGWRYDREIYYQSQLIRWIPLAE